jgi:hypothetical protein
MKIYIKAPNRKTGKKIKHIKLEVCWLIGGPDWVAMKHETSSSLFISLLSYP